MCGNDYSLTYYNNDKRQWETLPTDPIIEDIAWILDPEYPSGEQTIKLYMENSLIFAPFRPL